ncbi:MAG: collagen-like triple helix repeat-containing protein [Calditrichia bacterium]
MTRYSNIKIVTIFLSITFIAPLFSQTQSISDLVKKHENEIIQLKKILQDLQKQKGERGSQGSPGERGPRGYRGLSGEPGNIPDKFSIKNNGHIKFYSDFYKKYYSPLKFPLSENGINFNKINVATVYIGHSRDSTGILIFNQPSGTRKVEIGVQRVKNPNYRTKIDKNQFLRSNTWDRYEYHGYVNVHGKKVHDFAEVFELSARNGVIPGTVMSASEEANGILPSVEAFDQKVVGVISGAGDFSPGLVIGTRKDGSSDLPIAIGGQVYVRVCAEGGSIEVGDLLVSSTQRGVAMKCNVPQNALGTIIGKALEPYANNSKETEGLIRMFIMNR